jgi:predicted RNase H-like HicB family nuclease
MLEYRAAYYLDKESGWYTVQLLDFPAVISQGRTLNSARNMIRDALREMVEWCLEEGSSLPSPNPRLRDKKAEFVEPLRIEIRVKARSAS